MFSRSDMVPDFSSSEDEDPFWLGYSEPMEVLAPPPPIMSVTKFKRDYRSDLDLDKKIAVFIQCAEDNEEGDLELMGRILEEGIPIDAVGFDNWPALMKACLNGHSNVAQFLLNRGSNPNFRSDLFTSLMACCTLNRVKEDLKLRCIEVLLNHNVDVNMVDKHKTSALMYAAGNGYKRIVTRLLLVPDIDIQIRDFEGWNAVFHAVHGRRLEIVKILIEAGCDFRTEDMSGRTALILAEERNVKSIAKFLMAYEEREEELTETEEDPLAPFFDYLKDLPLPNGEGGFTTDTEDILATYGYEIENVSFPEFLTMNATDLHEIGLKFPHQRSIVLRNIIHKFHLYPWKKNSMGSVNRDIDMGIEEVTSVVGSMAKHLTLMKASLKYLIKRIEMRRYETRDISLERDLLYTMLECHEVNEKVWQRLNRVRRDLEHVEMYVPEDIIKPYKKPIPFFKWLLFGAAGFLLYIFKRGRK